MPPQKIFPGQVFIDLARDYFCIVVSSGAIPDPARPPVRPQQGIIVDIPVHTTLMHQLPEPYADNMCAS